MPPKWMGSSIDEERLRTLKFNPSLMVLASSSRMELLEYVTFHNTEYCTYNHSEYSFTQVGRQWNE